MALNDEIKNISITFSEDEAVVLFEWLAKFNTKENTYLFEDQAEQRVLYDLEASLEKNISSVFSDDYKTILLNARKRVKG